MMKRIFLLSMLALGFAGLAIAQDTTGPKAEKVKKEILKLEEEKLKAFQSTGTSNNTCPDWVRNNDAEAIVHINSDGTEDTKAGLVKDLEKGNRILHSLHYGPQNIRVYGEGENGTTAVTTYLTSNDIEVYGKRTSSEVYSLDVWVKRDGKWWFVAHSVHERPTPEALKRQAERTKEN
ncbi:MAG TPA: nuclear transport factor 2 family protein [Candidatus Saccharimonadales bacterium]|nr:nuclear transport factor 2 family protein [Candidatus Saccharimonadales bacterium]